MENELIDNFQSEITQSQTDSKQRGLVKTFGWISFGIAIFYLFSGLISLVTTSLMSSVSSIASAAGNNELDFLGRIGGMQQLNAGLTALIAVLIIVGAIGFVTFREWGRKLYIAGCICAVVVNLVGIYISIYSMSVVAKMTDKMSSVSPEEAQVMESVFGTFGSFFSIIAIVFSLIPITNLVINVFIAVNSKTKALMS